MIQPIIRTKRPTKMKSISLEELKSCPKHILTADHWTPVHKVEECGADKVKEKIIEDVSITLPPIKKIKKPKSSMYQDIEKTCVCGAGFIWTAGEQKFMNRLYEEGKVKEIVEPKRCPACRKAKKERFERKKAQGDNYQSEV